MKRNVTVLQVRYEIHQILPTYQYWFNPCYFSFLIFIIQQYIMPVMSVSSILSTIFILNYISGEIFIISHTAREFGCNKKLALHAYKKSCTVCTWLKSTSNCFQIVLPSRTLLKLVLKYRKTTFLIHCVFFKT